MKSIWNKIIKWNSILIYTWNVWCIFDFFFNSYLLLVLYFSNALMSKDFIQKYLFWLFQFLIEMEEISRKILMNFQKKPTEKSPYLNVCGDQKSVPIITTLSWQSQDSMTESGQSGGSKVGECSRCSDCRDVHLPKAFRYVDSTLLYKK